MADEKLSALTELAATPAVDDEVYIRDVSEAAADESKRITTANLLGSTTKDAAFTAADEIMVGTGVGTHGQVTLAASQFLAKKAAGAATNVTVAEALTMLNVTSGADVTGSNAPQAHKASHETAGADEINDVDINAGTIDGVTIGGAAAPTVTNLGTVTTADINGGTIGGVTLDGVMTMAETGILLDPVLSGDGTYSGITEGGTAGATLAIGDICYLAVADTRWELAKADVAATSFGKIGMCVQTAAADGSATTMLLFGKIRAGTLPALTVGAPVFISAATAGDVTMTAPTGTTNLVVRIVGYGNTAEDLFFCPDNTYLELA